MLSKFNKLSPYAPKPLMISNEELNNFSLQFRDRLKELRLNFELKFISDCLIQDLFHDQTAYELMNSTKNNNNDLEDKLNKERTECFNEFANCYKCDITDLLPVFPFIFISDYFNRFNVPIRIIHFNKDSNYIEDIYKDLIFDMCTYLVNCNNSKLK